LRAIFGRREPNKATAITMTTIPSQPENMLTG
jgi:hypothetical protein